jgi:hypothetical protein
MKKMTSGVFLRVKRNACLLLAFIAWASVINLFGDPVLSFCYSSSFVCQGWSVAEF